jgi:hypothetical protein
MTEFLVLIHVWYTCAIYFMLVCVGHAKSAPLSWRLPSSRSMDSGPTFVAVSQKLILSQFLLLSVWAGRSGDWIPVGVRFSAPIQTGPRALPASYTMGTRSFSGVKRPGHGVDHPPPSSAKVKGRIGLYFYTPSGPSWPALGWTFYFDFVSCASGTKPGYNVVFVFVFDLVVLSVSQTLQCQMIT